jgi:peptidoglycan lytic transglycosylase G
VNEGEGPATDSAPGAGDRAEAPATVADAGSGGGGAPTRASTRHRRNHPGALRRHPFRLAAVVVILGGLSLIVGVFLWVRAEADPSGPLGRQVVVKVAPNASVNTVISALAARDVVGSALAYRVWSQFNHLPSVQAGTYAFHQNSSFDRVRSVLAAGPNVFGFTIPAGFTVHEVAERVGQVPGFSQKAFEALATSGTVHSPWQPVGVTNLDGLLGTGNYRVVPGETEQDLLVDMVDRFDELADGVGLSAGAARLGYTPYQVITIASIVEKEGVIKKNLGPVARVIYNRLAAGMMLQMDSTVLYAEGRDGGTVTSTDLALQSPYNTYLNTGLTPTPICFPSQASLTAALNPPPGSWLYFVVVKSDGTEAFADTFAEQQANEALAKQRGLP